ncbi:DUF551 domain-containing protein [Klebsiella quasipneumoniae]|uniref:DUF551 domain-containing protein n=1 Tax=Klebsiella quasipneumoniae TaxID=1463165 RepID=UPI00222F220D|nr:DUF551 domain-containing protein [Klebsiella quasipneumoniae]MDM9304842.1 DUF551 domain-containing protein [Klebsiella quasipneumoniae subsp. similipneumoniae]
MTKSTITRERAQQIFLGNGPEPSASEERELARMALAAMDSESECLPLYYLQGHKDGLEWAAQLAEANHPETGDWLYDDPIELAKAIRKGPDMPPAQPAADSEPVAWTWQHLKQWHVTNDEERARDLAWDGVKVEPLYRHPQPAPVVPEEMTPEMMRSVQLNSELGAYAASNLSGAYDLFAELWKEACRAAMLAAAPQSPGSEPATVRGKWIPVSERMPEGRTQVILWDDEIGEVTSGHYSHKTHTFYHCGDAIENEITHWMPPPAAPQEVKGE